MCAACFPALKFALFSHAIVPMSPGRHRIFDAHTHVYPDSKSGFWKQPSNVDALIAAMDGAGVASAAVIAIAPHIPTEEVCTAVAKHPGRLVAIGSVNPHDDGAVAAIDRFVDRLGVRAIKVHPRLQGISFEHLDRLVPIARRCAHHRIPLVVCSFAGGRDLFRARTLELCHELAAASPDTALILAHAGGHRPLDALMVLKANPNVHVDLSFSPWYFGDSSVQQDLEYFVRKADPQRVLFGSDFPEAPIQASLGWLLDLAKRLDLKPGRLSAILHDNAARLFRGA
jgi:predicted TIM-barrel fold metal-dependent hydrolase